MMIDDVAEEYRLVWFFSQGRGGSPRRRLDSDDFDLHHVSDTDMGLAYVPENKLYDYRNDLKNGAFSDSSG